MESPQTRIKSSELSDEYRQVFADIFSQSITGELIGMLNFASLANVVDDVEEMMEAVEHADSERGHAEAFTAAAAEMGVDVIVNVDAPYWKRIRQAFQKWAQQGDMIACFVIQEIMLESFAVSMYDAVSEVAKGSLSGLYSTIADEEREHLEHAVEILQDEYRRDPSGFTRKVHEIHEDVMTVLGEMVAKEDIGGECGLCHGTCMKETMHYVDLNISNLRGRALNFYLATLDRIGLPGDQTLNWVANLPA
jgi:fatty aldehyde decarbonylase